jgi:hypothetical protein
MKVNSLVLHSQWMNQRIYRVICCIKALIDDKPQADAQFSSLACPFMRANSSNII